MTYNYENLGDERFQHLCQAILATSHPDVQCLPVGQPDGGRDALIWRSATRARRDGVVFQVKFTKDPSSKDERTVIEELIKSEARKVATLKERGMDRYYLLTNVRGTSHYDSGSIDKVNEALSEAFDIPAYCWWRDDLDRRIDGNSSIKWSFPDILKASDLLQALYDSKFGVDESRRLAAIKAYLAYQHKYDSQLKFKQVDLEKGLVDLFVDVPAAAVGPANPREREKWQEQFERTRGLAALVLDGNRRNAREEEDRIGAVCALVDPVVTANLPRVVIEGAPGQGKSTVTQFLCQLHRMQFLHKVYELGKVPSELRPTDIRLPLRVDLRDYATWLSGRTPFHDAHTQSTVEGFSPSLESFLAAQISAQSGGMQFTPDDLLAFASNSALLIVLDGFDEVADVPTRDRLVREISDASTRFEGNSISNQVIVTSRPAAFANSPGFPRDEWQYIQILPLTRSAITAYTDKWMSGHSLDIKEKREITSVLNEKLEYPHVRELARNPMQLAILLALISTQGASLPDKRTTLYDRYVDIFFNRESEKSRVVRDKRDLLIGMHRYLAWTLQVEAESDAKAGNITEERLREVLRAYLTEIGHDPKLVDDLFVGMVERVVALVSRVQGTFEFEVQPLREYFAARYLYDTAPHIQAGTIRSGSIMDRFDALARNAYWLNVTRFYCGCYSTGELPSLVDGLISIGHSEQYSGTTYVTELAMTLLSDYVFSQQPRSVNRITEFMIEDTSFRLLLSNLYEERNTTLVSLPEESGSPKLLEAAIKNYKSARHFDTAYTSATIIKANLGDQDVGQVWDSVKEEIPIQNALFFGSYLDVTEKMPAHELISLVDEGGTKALRTCVYRGRAEVLNLRPDLMHQFLEATLDGTAVWLGLRSEPEDGHTYALNSVQLILTLIGALSTLSVEKGRRRQGTLLDHARRFGHSSPATVAEVCNIERTDDMSGEAYTDVIVTACTLVGTEVTPSTAFENDVAAFLGAMIEAFGYRSLIVDAGIAALEWLQQGEDLPSTGFIGNLSEIRGRSSQVAWWNDQFEANVTDRFLLAKTYLAWVDAHTLEQTFGGFSAMVERLSNDQFHSLYASTGGRNSPYSPQREPIEPKLTARSLCEVSPRAAALALQIIASNGSEALFKHVLYPYDGEDEDIIDARLRAAWLYAAYNNEFWPTALEIVADGYSRGLALDRLYGGSERGVPILEAKKITRAPELYPLSVVNAAERTLTQRIGVQVIPVGSVAAKDGWFC